jgi:large subunit ribosomal protein L9|tara:strand:- start:9890 stop:10342 length:453 start_codon:yes stop_codon:yes gene_type:complete
MMEVILLNKVENLGELGDKVNVRSGYARNYLIPQGRAKFATAANIAEFETRRSELEAEAAAAIAAAEVRKASLDGLKITIEAKEASDGKLFGSINNIDVLAAIARAGQQVEKREVRMPEGAFRTIGEHSVELHLHTDINATITINIVAED